MTFSKNRFEQKVCFATTLKKTLDLFASKKAVKTTKDKRHNGRYFVNKLSSTENSFNYKVLAYNNYEFPNH